ncbi:Disease resistance protein L6 [Linum perenne]
MVDLGFLSPRIHPPLDCLPNLPNLPDLPVGLPPQPSQSPLDCPPNLPVGPDSRLTFTDFLYTYLVQARIRTFRDDDELRKGHTVAPELIKAIHESKIEIPIFSPNCASSKWCNQGLILG